MENCKESSMSVLHHLFSWRLDDSNEDERDHLHEKQMDAEGDSPKDRGTARNVGDITCPGQENQARS